MTSRQKKVIAVIAIAGFLLLVDLVQLGYILYLVKIKK